MSVISHKNVAVTFGRDFTVTGDVTIDLAPGPLATLMLVTEDQPAERLNVALVGYGLTPAPGCVFLKNWSEHRGLTESLVKAGVVEVVNAYRVGGYESTAYEVRILEPVADSSAAVDCGCPMAVAS